MQTKVVMCRVRSFMSTSRAFDPFCSWLRMIDLHVRIHHIISKTECYETQQNWSTIRCRFSIINQFVEQLSSKGGAPSFLFTPTINFEMRLSKLILAGRQIEKKWEMIAQRMISKSSIRGRCLLLSMYTLCLCWFSIGV